jgi:hypothetical protein
MYFSHSAARFPMPHPILEALLPPSLEPGVCVERRGGAGLEKERARGRQKEIDRASERVGERVSERVSERVVN